MGKSTNFLGNLSPKTSFIFGLVVGVLVICAIGFFILLGMVLDNKEGDTAKVDKNANVNQQADEQQLTEFGPQNLKAITKNDNIRGNINAPITIVEFSDYQCPFCEKVHPTLQRLLDEYEGQVAWVYKHFPLDSLHPYARKAAEAAECAAEQNKFWEYTDNLYANQQLINLDYLVTAAESVNLNTDDFESCLADGKYANKVIDHQREAANVGITGTPGIYVNDTLIKGAVPFEQFQQVIDSLL